MSFDTACSAGMTEGGGELRYAASATSDADTVNSLPSWSTTTWLWSLTSPARSFRASAVSSSFWISRLRGRAP